MRAVDFCYNILDKFAPMGELERTELRRDAQAWYLGQTEKLKAEEAEQRAAKEKQEKPKALSNTAQIVKTLEGWFPRTLIAVLYIWVVPQIQEYINGEKFEDDDDDDDR